MVAIPDSASTKITLLFGLFLLLGAVSLGMGMMLESRTHERADRICDNACLPREGFVVAETCYCENQGLSLVPIDMMIPDTGLCGPDGKSD